MLLLLADSQALLRLPLSVLESVQPAAGKGDAPKVSGHSKPELPGARSVLLSTLRTFPWQKWLEMEQAPQPRRVLPRPALLALLLPRFGAAETQPTTSPPCTVLLGPSVP